MGPSSSLPTCLTRQWTTIMKRGVGALSGANFFQANLCRADLSESNLNRATLTHIQLPEAVFSHADFSGG